MTSLSKTLQHLESLQMKVGILRYHVKKVIIFSIFLFILIYFILVFKLMG